MWGTERPPAYFPPAILSTVWVRLRGQVLFLDEDRDAYESGHRQLPQIGAHFGLHYSTTRR
ncbi:hypothetical protein RM530_16585 [Algiphilus sp. W345]|uniref:Transposase n=1 Tax=Banduia mediterranea TaxID=3075609 RepID=A0ABU2WM79_9GAMM|nr:hypothetical protein [Algiphilus sp. W345]MDT0498962.1 hypothetical protein [Algiphilus sp. W345]